MKNNQEIVLASAIDNNYAQHLGVLLVSIFENKGSEKIKYYVIDGGITEKNKKRLLKISKKYKFELIFNKIDETQFRDLKVTHHFNATIYFCLTVPNILYKKYNKILFLDADTIVIGSLRSLWKTDTKNSYLGALCDRENFEHNHHIRLSLRNKNDYFNSGVMLINTNKWVENDILNKVVKFVEDNHKIIEYPEQDGLSFIVDGNYKKIPKKYNYSVIHHPNFRFFKKVKPPQDILIYHFATSVDKPWNFSSVNYFKKRYWSYLRKTPWRFSMYKDIRHITLKKIFIKYKMLFLIFINQQAEVFEFIKKIKNIGK